MNSVPRHQNLIITWSVIMLFFILGVSSEAGEDNLNIGMGYFTGRALSPPLFSLYCKSPCSANGCHTPLAIDTV